MADQVTLAADARPEKGRKNANRLRMAGRTPAVMYGRGVDAVPVTVDQRELYHALHTPAGLNVLIRLQVNGEEHLTIARDVQRHPVREDILHVDFLAVSRDQQIDVEVPIHLLGDGDVSRETGGVVNQILHTLPLKVLPLEVPNSLELSVIGMQIGDVRRVGDIELPEGSELNIDPERTIVTINAPTILEEPEEAEEVVGLEGMTAEEIAELSEDEKAALVEEAEAEAEAEGDGGAPAGDEGGE